MDLDDLQGLIARGFPSLKAASYVLLGITAPDQARAWLASLPLTAGGDRQPERALNLAFTAAGLRKLGLDPAVLDQFSNELTAGMTTPHRRRMLGDLGPSAPEQWLWGGPSTPAIDALLLVFAVDETALASQLAALANSYAGVTEILRLDATIDLDGREHFGFADGISQPTIAGLSNRMDLPSNTIQPGEIVLGYPNEYGRFTDRPLLDAAADPTGVLPRDAAGSGKPDLARNGAYLVFRQLSQDVRGFWGFVDQAVGGDAQRRTWLAAKMVGRWPSGAPLTLAPDEDAPNIATYNDFTYHHFDADGLGCPIGAHVRRSHPRDSLDPDPGTERSVSLDRRHRVLRRGREYGPPVSDPLSAAPPDDPDRGLYFICLVANIARQFEFIQHTWLNNPKFGEHYDEPDPIVGYHPAGAANFSIPATPIRERYHDLPQFVTTRGGAYFFLPGLRAVRFLTAQPKTSSPVGS
jgi:Dyp-type peroxidase family